jgi:hypothetical protein
MLTYAMIAQQPRRLQAMTTLRWDEFEGLLVHFAAALAATHSAEKNQAGQPRQRKAGGGRKARLDSPADKLLFILVYEKTYPLQTAHGVMFGLSQAQTNDWLHRLQPVLASALEQAGYAPARDQVTGPTRALQLDGTERPRQRPQDPTRWRTHYSGKKTTHR